MLRALADARTRLLYGVTDGNGSATAALSSVVAYGEVAGLLLREHRMAVQEAPTAAPAAAYALPALVPTRPAGRILFRESESA